MVKLGTPSLSFCDLQVPQEEEKPEGEELSRLKHNIRVLETTLKMEKNTISEYYTEIVSKTEEYEQLRNSYSQLESKLECLQRMNDVQDELAHTKIELVAANKKLAVSKGKEKSLEEHKEKVADLERKVKDFDVIRSQLDESKLVSFSICLLLFFSFSCLNISLH